MAADHQKLSVLAEGGHPWVVSWHPPASVPDGRPHGENAFCVTSDESVVLISPNPVIWGWPGGRPADGDTWEDTLRREMHEEACVEVVGARLLGFVRSACRGGPERGLVLVRNTWRAHVRLLPWDPHFEIPHRRVVPASELGDHLCMEPGSGPIYRRARRGRPGLRL